MNGVSSAVIQLSPRDGHADIFCFSAMLHQVSICPQDSALIVDVVLVHGCCAIVPERYQAAVMMLVMIAASDGCQSQCATTCSSSLIGSSSLANSLDNATDVV